MPAAGNRPIKQKTVKGALFSSDNSGNSRTNKSNRTASGRTAICIGIRHSWCSTKADGLRTRTARAASAYQSAFLLTGHQSIGPLAKIQVSPHTCQFIVSLYRSLEGFNRHFHLHCQLFDRVGRYCGFSHFLPDFFSGNNNLPETYTVVGKFLRIL
jgi:hypothetical protein